MTSPSLVELMRLSPEAWDEFTRGSPVRRARREGLLRNVAVALGNWGSEEAVPPLLEALSDSAPLVRGHAAWALGEMPSPSTSAALAERLAIEEDAWCARSWSWLWPASPKAAVRCRSGADLNVTPDGVVAHHDPEWTYPELAAWCDPILEVQGLEYR